MIHRHHLGASHRCATIFGALILSLSVSFQAQADTARLTDLWLEQPSLPEAPAYSYYLLEQHREQQQRQGRRLQEELATLKDWYHLAGQDGFATSLNEWQLSIAELQASPGRTPARADLAALLASPRHAPALTSLAAVGHCTIPDWVELWHFGGVTRQHWTPGLSLHALLRSQPRNHWSGADEAWVVTPQSDVRRIGVAAWNAGDTALVAGSRIVVALPEPVQEANWVNRTLPAFLATRLPGDSCRALALPDGTDQADTGRPAT